MKVRQLKASILFTLARKVRNKDWFPIIIVLTDGRQFLVKKAAMVQLRIIFSSIHPIYIEVVVVRKKCFGYQINQSRHFY